MHDLHLGYWPNERQITSIRDQGGTKVRPEKRTTETNGQHGAGGWVGALCHDHYGLPSFDLCLVLKR